VAQRCNALHKTKAPHGGRSSKGAFYFFAGRRSSPGFAPRHGMLGDTAAVPSLLEWSSPGKTIFAARHCDWRAGRPRPENHDITARLSPI